MFSRQPNYFPVEPGMCACCRVASFHAMNTCTTSAPTRPADCCDPPTHGQARDRSGPRRPEADTNRRLAWNSVGQSRTTWRDYRGKHPISCDVDSVTYRAEQHGGPFESTLTALLAN